MVMVTVMVMVMVTVMMMAPSLAVERPVTARVGKVPRTHALWSLWGR